MFYNIRFKRGTACYHPFLKVLGKPNTTNEQTATPRRYDVRTDYAILVVF